MSALSQAAFIHVNDPTFDEHIFRENFNMHTSTSPMYSMIASLDVSRKQAVMEGYKLLQRTLMLADELRHQINATGAFRVPVTLTGCPTEFFDGSSVTYDIILDGSPIATNQPVGEVPYARFATRALHPSSSPETTIVRRAVANATWYVY
jgi:hypothetical protein